VDGRWEWTLAGQNWQETEKEKNVGEKGGDMRLFVCQFAYNRNDTGRRGGARRD